MIRAGAGRRCRQKHACAQGGSVSVCNAACAPLRTLATRLIIGQVPWLSTASACAYAAHLSEVAGLTHARKGHDRQYGRRGQTAQEPVEDSGLGHSRSALTPDTL